MVPPQLELSASTAEGEMTGPLASKLSKGLSSARLIGLGYDGPSR